MSNFLAALNKLHSQFEAKIEEALDDIAANAQQHAKSSTLFKGNNLKNSIKILNNGYLSRTVLADKDYAYYVEYGNNQKGPYIYPVRAKYLHFFMNGQEFFRKRVRSHPPLPFMHNALEDTTNKIEYFITNKLKEIL